MKRHFYRQLTLGIGAVVATVIVSVVPSYALMQGGRGFHGGGSHGGGFRPVGFHRGFHHGFHHHPFFFHRPCCFGPRVFIGVGVGVPIVYPYPYPVYYPPVVVESAPPADVRAERQFWYYCRDSQAFYPYVKECPGGWLQVVPQPSPRSY